MSVKYEKMTGTRILMPHAPTSNTRLINMCSHIQKTVLILMYYALPYVMYYAELYVASFEMEYVTL